MLLFARAPPAAPAFPAIPKESETNLVSDILGASPTTMLGACRFRHPNVSLESSSSARRCADGGFTNYIRPTQMSQKVYAKPAAHTHTHTGCWQIRVPLCFLMFVLYFEWFGEICFNFRLLVYHFECPKCWP